ncbi:MAG TPA: DUF2470 domain-containing protein [Acetobacteraceae bacterium]|nr:DUF2470 domain-containing protein [Acetobacteraceae bacterium]
MAEAQDSPAWVSRRLLRAARAGTLASATDGQPFASLVTPACAPDGAILLLLSELSEHTRHLRAEPRCAVMVAGAPESDNPQTAPRVTVTGLAATVEDAGLKARWLSVHPYGALYADFADFHLWRIAPRGALFVGGFARAHRLRSADLAPDPQAVMALAAAEAEIIAHCNTDHADAMAAIGARASGTAGAWRLVTADVDGCDLALEARSVRVAWAAPVSDPAQVRAELIRLARAARG